MRASLLDLALSTGLEGITPPTTVVEAASDTTLATARTLALGADADLKHAHQTLSDLTRLGNGLEGLMIEVAHLENKDDVTSEELAALRESAMAVRRQFLTEDERRVFDGMVEGRLEGSTEGLGDLLKNVGTKLGFAVGNFFDSVKRSFGGNKDVLVQLDRKLTDIIARLNGLPEATYERTLSKDDAVLFAMNGKVDVAGAVGDLTKTIDAWFYQPMTLTLDRIEQLSSHLTATLATTTEEDFNRVIEEQADKYAVPLPASAKKTEVVTGKYYMFDVYDLYQSYSTRDRTVYVARPNHNSQINSQQYDNAAALGVSEAMITHLRARNAQPANVSFSKAGLLDALRKVQGAVKDLIAYTEQQAVIGKSYRNYVSATNNYETFKKGSFVNKLVLARVSTQAGAILSLFDMTCISFYDITDDLDKMTDVLKAFVYSSDLSKG